MLDKSFVGKQTRPHWTSSVRQVVPPKDILGLSVAAGTNRIAVAESRALGTDQYWLSGAKQADHGNKAYNLVNCLFIYIRKMCSICLKQYC